MEFSSDYKGWEEQIIHLFTATFSAAEGPDEGEAIGMLVSNMFETTNENDLLVFLAWQKEELAGAIVFTRLTYPDDERNAFILSPVAVATSWQRKGIGQALLMYGLNFLRKLGVDVAITYGDPDYYAKVGFKHITEEIAQAPLTLQQPEGWLAQSLNGHQLTPLKGPSRCVEALSNQIYW